MNLSAEQRAKLLEATKAAAAALLEDLAYMRELGAKQDHLAADLRRASAVLRRLIIEEDIVSVAAPRIGRLRLLIPDYAPFYATNEICRIDYFGTANRMQMIMMPAYAGYLRKQLDAIVYPTGEPKLVSVRLDTFKSQRVLCFRGDWTTRAATIKYMANEASGVHTEKNMDAAANALIANIRRCTRYIRRDNGEYDLRLYFDGSGFPDAPPLFNPGAIDPLQHEMLHAMRLITASPDILRLEEMLQAELRA